MKKNLLIILTLGIFVVFFVVFMVWFVKNFQGEKNEQDKEKYFTPTSENFPVYNDSNVLLDENIYIYFNQNYYEEKIDQKDLFKKLIIITNPEFEFSLSVDENKKAIKISPLGLLQKNTDYQIKVFLKNPEKNPAFRGFPFETIFKAGNKTGKDLKNDPALLLRLKNKIPVFNEEFEMDYIKKTGNFAIIIKSPNCQEARDKALGYLKENGVDIEKAEISWYTEKEIDASCVPIK